MSAFLSSCLLPYPAQIIITQEPGDPTLDHINMITKIYSAGMKEFHVFAKIHFFSYQSGCSWEWCKTIEKSGKAVVHQKLSVEREKKAVLLQSLQFATLEMKCDTMKQLSWSLFLLHVHALCHLFNQSEVIRSACLCLHLIICFGTYPLHVTQ